MIFKDQREEVRTEEGEGTHRTRHFQGKVQEMWETWAQIEGLYGVRKQRNQGLGQTILLHVLQKELASRRKLQGQDRGLKEWENQG